MAEQPAKLRKRFKEGGILLVTEDKIIIDHEETKTRKIDIEALTKDLWK